MELGVEDGDSDPLGGEPVGVGARVTLDQTVEAEAAEVVAHLRRAVAVAEESGHLPAKALVGEAGDGVDDEAERAGNGQAGR